MIDFFATEAMEKRAGFMPRGDLTPEQQSELDGAKTRWVQSGGSPSDPVTSGVTSPGRQAILGALGGGVIGGVAGMGLGGPLGAAIGAPTGALLAGLHARGAANDRNQLIEEAMRRGAQNQFDLDTLPQNTSSAVEGVGTQLAAGAAMRRLGV